ncbi:DUF2919 domain-containing protein [Escherichia coli]|uniref:DUF2919 domain-containing protein n=1 Tax=Escherichia coli TaxID=562 RepID=UPI0021D08A18|nr:DUF2919 domain-containing protein [Escherichia coli]MCU6261846.1 DUF2919 domain-containing protein [Escherichia coli]
MTRPRYWRESDFNDHGLLTVPLLFWCGLLLQTRAWWLTGLAMAAEHGTWLEALYPVTWLQVTGLAAGVPALAMLFCYPLRGTMPGLAKGVFGALLAGVVAMTVSDVALMLSLTPEKWETGWLMLCTDLACVVALMPDRRLRAVFIRPV